jgi:GT2 family glycosyltransferase
MRHIKKLATRVGNKGTQVTNTETTKKVTPKITIQKSVVVTDRIESPTPVINILTRTSNRPNGFKRCRESIVNQTYKNIRHLVSIDNLNDEEYVKSHNVEYFFMDKEAISKENDIPDPKTGTRFIYNLYLNHLINEVKEGWVFILDDDDYFADSNCVQKMVNAIKNTTDIVLWQMKYPNGQILPSLQELGAPPKLARISSQCFMVHSGIAKTIRWDGWKCGDFRFVQKAYAKTGEKRVIREVLVNLNGAGLGMKKDIAAPNRNIDLIFNDMNRKPSQEMDANAVVASFRNKFAKNIVVNDNSNQNNNNKKASFEKRIKLEIISVGWNCEKYAMNTYNSLKNQIQGNYDYTIHMLDDGSTDKTYNILKRIADSDPNVKIYRNNKNYGAAYSRNLIISQLSDIDAVGLMIDLDDTVTNDTFLDISNHYLKYENCLMTFGNFKFASSGKVLNAEIYDKQTIDNVKFLGKGFSCPPLRTFRIGAAQKVPESIYKNENGEWYKYCTDVCLSAAVLAQSYGEQIYKINKAHYIYNDTRTDGTQQTYKNKKAKTAQLIFEKIENAFKNGQIKKYRDELLVNAPYVAIVMCTWKRISRLKETLNLLSTQTYKNIKLHIWNNNFSQKENIQNIIKDYPNLNIEVLNSEKNVGGIGRFLYAKKIAKEYPQIIFIDDDQVFNNKFVEDFSKMYLPKSIISWFGWKMNGSYYNRTRVNNFSECDYCGTGGMLIDSSVFLDERLYEIPKEYIFIEDLWLSYFAKYEHSYNLIGCSIDLKIIEDGNDQYVNLKKLKEEFYKLLEAKYNGKRTFRGDLIKVINKLNNNIPFTLTRFGDGEMMIIENIPIDLSKKHHGEHAFNPKESKYQKLRIEMIEAIKYKSSNYYVGLPCPTCVGSEKSKKMYNYCEQSDLNVTWATLFGNSNYDTFEIEFPKALKNKEIVIVCHKNAKLTYFHNNGFKIIKEFRVGANAWYNNYEMIIDIVEYSKTLPPNTVFLFMAGTFTKICIYKMHEQRQDLFLIDIGSSLDLKLSLGETRNFFKKNHKNRKKECLWMGK